MESRYPWKYALFLMAYYVANALYQGYVPVYFQSSGLTASQIGLLVGMVPLISIFSQPAWGSVADRVRSRNRLLRILALCSAGCTLAMLISSQVWYLWLIMCIFAIFYPALQPMGDSIVLEALQPQRHPFGPIRLAGGLAFAIANVAFGAIFITGREYFSLVFMTGMLLLLILSTFALPGVSGHQSTGQKMSIRVLFKEKSLMRLLAFIMPLQITMGFFYTFFSMHFLSLPGGNGQRLGWAYFISACSEAPFLLMSDKLYEKLGAGKLISFAAVALTLRWVLLSTSNSVPLIMIGQVLHGWGFIVLTVSMAKHISDNVPDELKATGQMLLAVVGFGIARVVGNFGGGLLSDAIGIRSSFVVCAVVSSLTFLLFAPKYWLQKGKNTSTL